MKYLYLFPFLILGCVQINYLDYETRASIPYVTKSNISDLEIIVPDDSVQEVLDSHYKSLEFGIAIGKDDDGTKYVLISPLKNVQFYNNILFYELKYASVIKEKDIFRFEKFMDDAIKNTNLMLSSHNVKVMNFEITPDYEITPLTDSTSQYEHSFHNNFQIDSNGFISTIVLNNDGKKYIFGITQKSDLLFVHNLVKLAIIKIRGKNGQQ